MAEKKISFEDAINELEKTVNTLENGECTLDEAIALFEKGVRLSSDCRKTLDNARQKIMTLTDAENGAADDD